MDARSGNIGLVRKRTFASFTLIEVLVSMAVIAIAVTAILTVMAGTQKNMAQDKDLQFAVDFSNRYFSMLYISDDLKKAIFSEEDIRELGRIREFPHLAEPKVTNLSEGVQAIMNVKVNRWTPLLVDIGLEIVFTGKTTGGKKIRRDFWFETTLSESYLSQMI